MNARLLAADGGRLWLKAACMLVDDAGEMRYREGLRTVYAATFAALGAPMAIVERHQNPVRVEPHDGNAPEGTAEVAAVIDYDEYEEARREPKWRAFYDAAVAYRKQLIDNGHSS
jgi:hypothetical protein